MSIPFIDLKKQYQTLKEDIDSRIQKVLDHGQFILGPEVQEFEAQMKEFTGAKHAISCASGTDALILALRVLGIGHGDEVIVPGFSFIATAEVIVLVGAKPVFVDIERDTYNIDPSKVETAITEQTKAIIPVSLYGQIADMNAINQIGEKHNLPIIEDAAQSFGGSYNGKKSCSLSKLATTSFFPAKPLGCYGDGGAIFTDDDEIAKKLISIRFHGMSETERYKHVNIGMNSRLDTIQAAVLIAKLNHFPWELEQRQIVADRYDAALSDKYQICKIKDGNKSAFAQYTLWVENRAELQARLKDDGIPTAVHYPLPMYKQEAYSSYHNGPDLENSDWASQGVMSLPMHPYMDEEQQNKVIEALLL